MARIILAHEFWQALVKAGVMDPERDGMINRIVIDAREGYAVKMYIERYAEEPLLKIATTLQGISIKNVSTGEELSGQVAKKCGDR
jgi:hypothetical protein